MNQATVVWAKLFLIIIILAKPLGLKAVHECKHLGNNLCRNHNECCSGYCYMEPGWASGVCKRMKTPKKPDESKTGKNNEKNNEKNDEKNNENNDRINNGVHDRVEDVFETGVCGYYRGESLTASGDVFDESEMTAAHRTLPFNTKVKVETMGTSVVVKINDRKTSSDGLVMLLSRAAAENLNINENTGPVQCQLKILTDSGCTPDFGNTCVLHHECCSQNCFKEIYSDEGFCIPK